MTPARHQHVNLTEPSSFLTLALLSYQVLQQIAHFNKKYYSYYGAILHINTYTLTKLNYKLHHCLS